MTSFPFFSRSAALAAVTTLAACAIPADLGEHEEPAEEALTSFSEANSAHAAPASFVKKVNRAIALLERTAREPASLLQGRIAGETAARIREGAVLLDTITDALPEDLYHMCRDLHLASCASPLPDARRFQADATLRRTILARYVGYMWGNRIYLTVDAATDVSELASTLTHETNHVLNRSECNYYRDYTKQVIDDNRGYVEEYRAFVAECVFKQGATATAASCDAYATETVARDYSFHADLDAIASGSPLAAPMMNESGAGKMVPTGARWPRSFEECRTR